MLCKHETALNPVPPHAQGCEECLKSGTPWVHLRYCLYCGHIGCCDSSPGRHATKHFRTTGDPVAASFEPGEQWAWCYAEQEMVDVPDQFIPYLRS